MKGFDSFFMLAFLSTHVASFFDIRNRQNSSLFQGILSVAAVSMELQLRREIFGAIFLLWVRGN